MNNIDFTGRKFQFWGYKVSHGELLIRSPKDSVNKKNIDLMFFGTDYINLPRSIYGLEEIAKPTEEEVSFVKKELERLGEELDETNKIFILKSRGHRYIIVAATLKISENEMDIFETQFTSGWKI